MTTEAYGTDGAADTYHAERNNTAWAGLDAAVRTAARLVASEWIDNKYRMSFPGLKVGLRSQVREWPRTGAYDVYGNAIAVDDIPDEIELATYEAALRNAIAPGALNTDVTMGKNIKSVAVSGAVSVTYAGAFDPGDMQLTIPAVDRILAPILTGAGTGSRLSGQSVRA